MSEIEFDVNVAIDVCMEVYPFRVNQSEPLLHAEIKMIQK